MERMTILESPEKAAECTRCVHYFISHDADFPYGCRALNFKSRMLPCREVFAASNTRCLTFVQKAGG